MLLLKDVWKGHVVRGKQRWPLKEASAIVPARRRVALFGPDAAANDLIIQTLSGAEPADKGSIRRVGLPCWPLGSAAFLDGKSTLRENAAFLGRVYGLDAADIATIAVDLSGVKLRRGVNIRRYPLTDRRMLALGLTLAIQFDWYFINQALPRAPLDRMAAIDGALADRISRAGVVWATTDPTTVAGYCDCGLVLDQGQLAFYDTLDGAVEAYSAVVEAGTRKPT
ncbi:hypothetical protein ACFQI3_06080 [Hansschlegelia quercus]|uniref:ABC transporter domain-containing protein n=1 Tax=Hansschlegelia quercus TaxID=2528245 RepID=A0A4Q9GKK2_9HYPH|nr:hypothetical protein [Hansschlegelia quercus]TBN53871.1 hypothetical protein EYR15_08760 [Hansschlegelia quercus]